MEAASYRQLLPDRGLTGADDYVRSLELRHRDPTPDRPYTVVNFVASVDGHATVDEQSRSLSDAGDRELFRALRERADAVLVGTGTLASERYRRILIQPERRERRIAAGLPAEPLVTTISRSGMLPLEIPLFAEPDARVVIFSPSRPETRHLAAAVTHHPLTGLGDALRTLRREHGVETLLCEGGPALFGAMVRARLVDELFLTIAPRLVGGTSGPAVVSGPPPEAPAELDPLNVLEREGTLFLRYRFAAAR